MRGTTRFRSASLAARLLTLVVIPSVALTVLAVQRIDGEQAAARDADEVVDAVALQQAVAAVYPSASLERIALEGLARVDEQGIPRTLVEMFAGVDLESIVSANAATLDGTLDDLDAAYHDLSLGGPGTLGTRLAEVRAALDQQRGLSQAHTARLTDIDAVFSHLDTILAEALNAATLPDDLPTGLAQNAASLRALSDVLSSSGAYGQAVLQALIVPNQGGERDAAKRLAALAYATHVAYLHTFVSTLAPETAGDLAPVRAQLSDFLADMPSTPAEHGATDPETVRASRDAILGLFDYLSTLQEYSSTFHHEVTVSVTVAADAADRRVHETQLVLLAIAALTATMVVVVLVSILRPLRRLTARAEAIGGGEIDLDPLPLRGPSDVRSLTSTMNDMVTTLHRANSEMRRLAAGDVDETNAPDVPGAIGIAIRESVRRLSAVTAELQRSQQLSTAIVTQAADAIWTVGPDGLIRTANEASGRMVRIPPGLQVGMPITDLLSATSGEAVVATAAGPRPKVLVANSVVDADSEQVTAVIAHDISERIRFEERLAYQANHDALTGLPNRFAVLDRLERLAQDGDAPAVLFIDLDTFKSVNDTHGHAVGDRVLARVATALVRCVRIGEFVGRLGGDEFVVIMREPGTPSEAIALGYRIIREIEQPQEHDGHVFVLSASVGIALPPAGTPALDAIRQADNAVYQAKRRGRGRVEMFDSSMQEHIEREAELELALRQAVRNDELVIHLQPVFDLATDRIMGAEALVRWNRPGLGMVPPNDFIPIAERSSLIFEVERWVLNRACELVAGWRRREPLCDYRIAVNISGRHLIEGDLLTDVELALTESGADPSMLELELTESQLLEDLGRATQVLDALRARGITIAVDDFGTGYSSMTYLRHLPIDCVKIDRSFVARATEHGYDSTVIEALLTIARTLGLAVVAEGVETESQLAYVRARGCHRAQGFLLSRPLPIEEAEAMMCVHFGTDAEACPMPVAHDRIIH